MTINNQIEALSIKNTMVKPVNMTEFNNPFLLLSSTKALNELVVNTNPSSRAKVANIEPTKSKFQQNPLGVPINVYTKDSATGAKDLSKKLKADAISKLSKQTASSAISSALSNVGKKAKAKPSPLPIYTKPVLDKQIPKKRGRTNQGKMVARSIEAEKKRVEKARKAEANRPKYVPIKRKKTMAGTGVLPEGNALTAKQIKANSKKIIKKYAPKNPVGRPPKRQSTVKDPHTGF